MMGILFMILDKFTDMRSPYAPMVYKSIAQNLVRSLDKSNSELRDEYFKKF